MIRSIVCTWGLIIELIENYILTMIETGKIINGDCIEVNRKHYLKDQLI